MLTDGHLYFTQEGDSIKAFDSQDGHGIKMLQALGSSLHSLLCYNDNPSNPLPNAALFDEIQGIGAKRKSILLKHFGNVKNIRFAKIDELYKVNGISKNLAEIIYGFFHSQKIRVKVVSE